MLPPLMPCLPVALCSLPSSAISAKMPDASPPPFWLAPVPPRLEDNAILRVEIRCSCHIELLDGQFAISHNEQTNDFFVELISPQDRHSAPVLCILFRFLPSQPEHLQIFLSSYGHWRRFGSVQRCALPDNDNSNALMTAATDEPVLRLHVHVHERDYSVELNGKEVERVEHRREFRQLMMLEAEEEKKTTTTTTATAAMTDICACQQQLIGNANTGASLMMATAN